VTRTRAWAALALALVTAAAPARAEPKYVLRLAAVAPEGTSWAREVRVFSRELEAAARGDVRVKWYLGGIAGSELEVLERIARGQLDGAGSAGPMCEKLAPSARVFAVSGLFQSRDEMAYVQMKLRPTLEEEFRRAGFHLLILGGLGPHVVLSRAPIRTLPELRRARLYRWDLDDVGLAMAREMGLHVVPGPLEGAAALWDAGKIDGFISIPTASLGYQWYTRAHHMLDLRIGFVSACLVMTSRAYDRLPVEIQRLTDAAAAKMAARIDAAGREQDDQLLGGLFQRQGVMPVAVADAVRTEFLAAARAARERLGAKLVAPEIMQRVLALLADYRVEHRR
jgi:TRAP-type transport system periplasmic protein